MVPSLSVLTSTYELISRDSASEITNIHDFSVYQWHCPSHDSRWEHLRVFMSLDDAGGEELQSPHRKSLSLDGNCPYPRLVL